MSVPALPRGTVLLHVGPHKTGTTAIQVAAAHRRADLAAAGVRYPGTKTHHSTEARSVGERGWGWVDRGGQDPPGPQPWAALLDEIRGTDESVFVSSEFFGELDDVHAERVVTDVGERLHVVATLRPLSQILPSSWQQYLKGGATRPFDDWLDAVLADPPNPRITPNFWQRQDHAALVRRWARAAGADRVTVIVLDGDRDRAPHTFEQLLGVPAGTLAPVESSATNRSMTAAECELVRQANLVLTGEDVGWVNYERAFRNGGVVRMVENRRPSDDEHALVLPRWAARRAHDLGARAADEIGATGVRVLGDLSSLAPAPDPDLPEQLPPPAADVPVAAAADLAVGIVAGAMRAGPFFDAETRGDIRLKQHAPPEDGDRLGSLPLREATTPELIRVLRRRVEQRVRRRLRR